VSNPSSAENLSPAIKARLLATCLMAIFLAALDQTIVSPALPIIAIQFGSWNNITWVITAYLLVTTAVIPVYGKASDIYGRRPVLTFAIFLFCLGSFLCAVATDIAMLSVARGIQALGGGGLIVLSMTVIGDIYAPRERGRYQGYISSTYASAAVLGPSLGGFLSDHFGWAAIFWINLPLGALTLIAAWSGLKHIKHVAKPRYLDLPGVALFVAGSSALVLAASSGGVHWEWMSREILGLTLLAGLSWLAFGLRVARLEDALISRHVMADKVVLCSIAAAFFCIGTLVGLSAYLPAFFQIELGLSATQAGLASVPLMLGSAFGATISGKSLGYMINYKRFPMFGLAIASPVTAILAVTLPHLSAPVLAALLTFTGIGVGTMLPVSLIVVQNAVRKDRLGSVTSIMNLARQLGAVLIVAAFGAAIFYGAPPSAHAIALEPALQPDGQIFSTGGFARVLWFASANLFLAWLLLLAMEQRPLRSGPA